MRALFRLTGSPGTNILLVLFWWPMAGTVWAIVALVQAIAKAVRNEPVADPARAAYEHTRWLPVGDGERGIARDIVTQSMSSAAGMITPDGLDQLADLLLAVGRAQTRGELADLVRVPLSTFGPLLSPPPPAHIRRRRTVLIVAGAALALLCVACGVIAAVTAPPQPKSWTEWCAQYHNADGTLTVGPSDIRRAVDAAERLPVPADATAAAELRSAVLFRGSYDSYSQRIAAEHMTNAAAAICA